MNIQGLVNEALKESIKEMEPTIKKLEELNRKINEGRYSSKTLQEEIYPKESALRRDIDGMKNRALAKVKDLVRDYKEYVKDKSALDPAQVTDDVKLLELPVALTMDDLEAILERNAGNQTMQRVVLRYAEEHNYDMPSEAVFFHGEEYRHADSLLSAVESYFMGYMDKPNALEMLEKMIPNPKENAVYTMPEDERTVYKVAMSNALDQGDKEKYQRLKDDLKEREALYADGVVA